jgi:hypothetical protein
MNESNVSLTISKEIVTPIVEAKIKEAIIEALGGANEVVARVVNTVLHQKVGADGKVSSYSSENKFDWLDVIVSSQLREAVTKELQAQISKSTEVIKDELIRALQTKKGATGVANALLSGLEQTFAQTWTSTVNVQIIPKS